MWYEIFDIIKQNCTTNFSDTLQDNAMELLLTARRKNNDRYNMVLDSNFVDENHFKYKDHHPLRKS